MFLQHAEVREILPGLVDSGADVSLLPLAIALELGIEPDETRSPEVSGISGSLRAFRSLSDVQLETEIGPVKLAQPILVPDLPMAVLGRPDFFVPYRICFEQSIEQIEIEPARHRLAAS